LNPEILNDESRQIELYEQLQLIKNGDTPQQKQLLLSMFQQSIGLLAQPFHVDSFDFGNDAYFTKIYVMGDEIAKNKELRKMNNARGSAHAIYIMRTFFGLYSLLNQLKAEVKMNYKLYES
jgi:hypothetical protein